ncbi:MAG: hypothetical protein FWE68_01740 [Defluviitaleaceae bacterium]|nr:hypothetical protein [Defluviitaleaceae bacterium]
MKSDKFKNMSRRELAEYVWDYYKLPIIAALFVIIVTGSLVNTFLVNPQKKPYIGLAVYGEFVDRDSIDALGALFTTALVPEELQSGWEAVVNNFYMDGNPQIAMAMSSKFAALMMMGEIDILIASREQFYEMISGEVLLPLDSLLPPEWADIAVMGLGIDITGGKALADCGIRLDRPVAGIAATSAQPELALRGIKLLLE